MPTCCHVTGWFLSVQKYVENKVTALQHETVDFNLLICSWLAKREVSSEENAERNYQKKKVDKNRGL